MTENIDKPRDDHTLPSATLLDRDPRFKYFDGLVWAVFNCRECDRNRGRKAVLSKFGENGWEKVKKINRTGVMAMFKVCPTPETELYSETVALAAETRCMKRHNAAAVIKKTQAVERESAERPKLTYERRM